LSVNFTMPNMPKTGSKHKPDIFAASAFFVLAAAGLYIVPALISLFTAVLPVSGNTLTSLSQFIYYTFFIVLPILLYMRRYPSSADTIRINPISGKCAFLCVLAAVIGVFLINIVSSVWMIMIEIFGGTLTESPIEIPKTTSGLISLLIFAAILPGICEELLFRGVLLGAWEEKGSVKAMAISSVWFTFLHASIEGIPAEFLAGMILAFVVISTDSLIAGMIYHTVHNSLLLILSYISERSLEAAGMTVNNSATLLDSMGGIIGVFSLLMPAAFLSGLLVLIMLALNRDRRKKNLYTFGYPPAPSRDFTVQEYAVIGSGFAIVLIMYLTNFLEIAGWL